MRRTLTLLLASALLLGVAVDLVSSTLSGANTLPPAVSSLSPATGPTGTEVTVSGTGLDLTTGVTFNGVAAYFQIVSATELTAVVPETSTTGDVTVTTSQGPATSTEPFTVVASATLPGKAWMSVVDQRTGHVYVSCPDTGTISVFDYTGNLVTTISGEPGAEGMAVVGDTLYVAQKTTGSITEVNTNTLVPIGTLATGLGGAESLVYAGGYLWVDNGAGLIRVNPATGVTTTFTGGYFSDNNDPASLRSDPANADTLIAVSGGDTEVSSLDAAASSPAWTEPSPLYIGDTAVGDAQDAVLATDGSELILGGDGQLLQFSYPSLAYTPTTYDTPAGSVTATAVSSADGGLVAAGFNYAANAEAVAVYALSGGSELFSARIGNEPGEQIASRTVAFDPTGTTLFAVVVSQNLPETFRAFPLPMPTPTISAVSPTHGSTSGGETVTITGSGLSGASEVKFGDTHASSVPVVTDDEIQAVSPPGTAGTTDISVITSGGSTAAVDADQFTYDSSTPPTPPTKPPTPPTTLRAITSARSATAVAGSVFLFSVTTSGSPTPRITSRGKLPRGLMFQRNNRGTASIHGTPRLNKRESSVQYPLTLTATFGRGKSGRVVTQAFVLTVVSPKGSKATSITGKEFRALRHGRSLRG